MRRGWLILLLIVGLAAAGARQPARAGPKDQMFNLAVAGLGTVGFTTLCYYAWKNSPAERAKGYPENLGPGEWYFAAYTGLSYLPPADWKLSSNFPPLYQGRTARHIVYQSAILGGIKFGRYFDSFPWFGVELETSFSRQAIHGRVFRDLQELREAVSGFVDTYNREWLVEKNGFLSPRQARDQWLPQASLARAA